MDESSKHFAHVNDIEKLKLCKTRTICFKESLSPEVWQQFWSYLNDSKCKSFRMFWSRQSTV